MSQQKQTPDDLVIQPRDLAFGRNSANPRWRHGNDPIATAYFNTLSASFPQGERFFIEAVRNCAAAASPELHKQIAAFTSQEFVHAREHVLFNRQATDAGYDLSKIEAFVKRELDFAKRRGPIGQLAITVTLEHFTAILGHLGLADPRHFEGASPENQRLWRWHAMEEIEHKAVAYDTYLAATKNWSAFGRWAMRCSTMVVSTVLFFVEIFYGVREHFRQDGINSFGTWLRFFHFLLVKPGVVRQMTWDYLAFYRPGFHPWQRDDRALIADFEATLAYHTATT